MYSPRPVDTSGVNLPQDLLGLTELLARNNHDIWALQRIRDGWPMGRKGTTKTRNIQTLFPTRTSLIPRRSMTKKRRLKS